MRKCTYYNVLKDHAWKGFERLKGIYYEAKLKVLG
jgi:hypothetical protein